MFFVPETKILKLNLHTSSTRGRKSASGTALDHFAVPPAPVTPEPLYIIRVCTALDFLCL